MEFVNILGIELKITKFYYIIQQILNSQIPDRLTLYNIIIDGNYLVTD